MGFLRYRRSIRIAPWFRINVSKTGISESLGKPGATINVRGDRVRQTVGLPGTGLSYITTSRSKFGGAIVVLIVLFILALIVSLR